MAHIGSISAPNAAQNSVCGEEHNTHTMRIVRFEVDVYYGAHWIVTYDEAQWNCNLKA